MLFLTAAVCFVIGLSIGWSGIAGFLLPIYFIGALELPVPSALALSFFAFLLCGIVGAVSYHRQGCLDVRFTLLMSAGSFVGALFGVWLSLFVPPLWIRGLLYLVVLLSGISILLRKNGADGSCTEGKQEGLLGNKPFVLFFGFSTGAICAISGAGGPILVMPLLVSMGMEVRTAVGVSLLNSVFIGAPAFVGYMMQVGFESIRTLLLVSGISLPLGVALGGGTARFIPQKALKKFVALFSIAVALWMFYGMI